MVVKNSQSYRLLSLVAMSGECSKEAMALLMPQESYRKKLLLQLMRDKLLKVYEKDGVMGYRLGRIGKETLLQIDHERFSFFLEDGADANMRRTKLPQRERQHRVSEVLAMMESSDAVIYRDRKNQIFGYGEKQTGEIAQSAFYLPNEVKEQTDLTRKIINSKLAGVWQSEGAVWVCYNMGSQRMNWYENVERRTGHLVCSVIREKGLESNAVSMILLGNSMEEALLCLDDPKSRTHFVNSFYKRVCFVPLDENGKQMLRLLGNAEMYEELKIVLQEDLEKKGIGNIECDGIDPDGRYVLILMDMDLKRLIRFCMQMRYINGCGDVYCFDFQGEVVRRFCSKSITISELYFEKVSETLELNI